MRKGAAGSSRGVIRFIAELLATLRRANVSGPVTVRADSGFWSWKLIDRLTNAGVGWSITVRLVTKITNTIAAIPEQNWQTIGYTRGGHAQVAETIYTTGTGKRTRTVRLVVRRTRLADTTQAAMWPTWRHHAFICNNTLTTADADRFHRNHAVVELAIRELKDNGLEHCPSGSFAANGAWLACVVLAHNLCRWAGIIALDGPIRTARTIRNRLIVLAGVLVNRSGTPTSGSPPTGHGHTNSTKHSTPSGRSPPPRPPVPPARGTAPHTPHTQTLTRPADTMTLWSNAPIRRSPALTPLAEPRHRPELRSTPADQNPIGGFRLSQTTQTIN